MLSGIGLVDLDLTDWDFGSQDLTRADLSQSNLTVANFVEADLRGVNLAGSTLTLAELNGADLRNANLDDTDHSFLPWAIVDSQTVYNQWTRFFSGFDPQEAGLAFVLSAAGDFDANDILDAADIDLFHEQPIARRWPWLVPMFDLNGHGVFDTSEMVTAFVDGGYEKGPRTDVPAIPEPSGWLLLLAGAVLWSLINRNRIAVVI